MNIFVFRYSSCQRGTRNFLCLRTTTHILLPWGQLIYMRLRMVILDVHVQQPQRPRLIQPLCLKSAAICSKSATYNWALEFHFVIRRPKVIQPRLFQVAWSLAENLKKVPAMRNTAYWSLQFLFEVLKAFRRVNKNYLCPPVQKPGSGLITSTSILLTLSACPLLSLTVLTSSGRTPISMKDRIRP